MEEHWNGRTLILIIAIVVMGFYLYQMNQQITALNNALNEANDNIGQLDVDVSQANDDIDNLNSQISDAQDAAWSDYDTMGSTLENLETVNDSFDALPTVSSSTQNQ
jgi:peptidoglycan hydrolase CwlO-like protein